MILLISNGEMAKHDVTFHEKHTSLNQDRLVQNRLLAADDRYDKEALIEFIGNSSKPKTAKSIREKSEELTGWLHSSKVALRKPEKDSVNSKGKDGPREFLSWRDSRLKLTPNPRENYVFKHYQDIRYYMKQYREENSTLDTASPQAPKRVSAFYHPGFYNVAPQPNREYSSCHLLSKIAQSSQNGTFQYTRRDSQKFDKPSLVPNLYKLVSTTARADSASSSENEAKGNTVPRNTSASGTRSKPPATAGKTPTKVSVPTPHNAISSVQGKLSGSNGPGSNGFHVKSEVLPTGSRTLDTLACVAAQEGQPDVEEAEKATAVSEASEAISIGKLSTTCLGADAVVKQSPKLEASCTYHIFPSESVLTQQATIVSSSSTMMWNPQKSAFERKPANRNEKDAGMNSPFKQPRSNVKLSVRRGDTNGNRSKRKYGKDEFPPLATGKMAKGSAVREHTLALMEIKGETSDAEKEPVLKVQSLSSQGRSHSTVSYGELHGSKKSRKMRTPTKKYCRSPIDEGEARHGSAGLVDQLHPGFELCVAEGPLEDVMTPEGFVPYHQYWNHNVPQRAIALTRTKKWCVDSDHNLKHLAEMVLADPPPLMAEFENGSGQQVQGPSIASGVNQMWFDTNGRAYVSLATRYDPVTK
ncbi:uncharacterized protein [Haliotis cracherodii]|uniref:uncharacterized protein n=1 Tax=Haliotis cracherodii TaxID=6455 RepID=UPI0039E88C4F